MRNALIVLSCLLVPALALAQNSPPVADAGPDQTILTDTATLLSGSATDPDGDPIVGWLWAVDSAPVGSNPLIEWPNQFDPLFLADLPGDYVLSLTATDGTDWSAPDFVTVHVRDLMPPTAVILADTTSGDAPLTVQFDGSTSTIDPLAGTLTFFWSFGDASASSAVNPVHTYDTPGDYLATLTVVDSLGQSDEDFVNITVTAPNNPPTISPTATPNSGDAPLVVLFSANAADPEGGNLTYLWDFGDPASDDNTSTLADPMHVYDSPGAYVAWLTVSDGPNEVSASVTVVVSAGQPLSTERASVVKWTVGNGNSNKGTVSYWGDLDLPTPKADDVIALRFDSVKLFSAPFSHFEPGLEPDVFLIVKRWLLVRLDLSANTIYVEKRKANLKRFDNSNGVDVELMWGDAVAVDQFVMTAVTDTVWTYDRP